MKAKSIFIAWALSMLALCICALCARGPTMPPPKNESPGSGPEFNSVFFKPGQPHEGDDLLDAVADASTALETLRHNARLIMQTKLVKYSIVGTTDDVECGGDRCIELSLIRAQLVQDWLIAHGVSQSILHAPIGHGTPMPPAYTSTEEDRFLTRSVQVIID